MIKILRENNRMNPMNYWFLQIKLPEISNTLKAIQNKISLDNIYDNSINEYGLEQSPHITILYGITDFNCKEKIENILKFYKPFNIQIDHNISKFENISDYEVLKLDIYSYELNRLHYIIKQHVMNESTYKIFKPHITIGYIKPKSCDYLINDKIFMNNKFILIDKIILTSPEKIEYIYNL